jgi:hypothetical protein
VAPHAEVSIQILQSYYVDTHVYIKTTRNATLSTLSGDTHLENPDECDGTYCRPYDSAELLSQFEGGKFKSVLHCRTAKFA